MTKTTKLASAALAGLLTAGLLAAQPALAGEQEKSACKGANGCTGKAAAEKSECKTKSSCNGKDGKSSCKGKDGEKASCSGKEEKK